MRAPARPPATPFARFLGTAGAKATARATREGHGLVAGLPGIGLPFASRNAPLPAGAHGGKGELGHTPVARDGHGAHGKALADDKPAKRHAYEDALDPTARHAAQLAPPSMLIATPELSTAAAAPEVHARSSLEHLLPALVKKIAWAGDGRRGTVRMEIGQGQLAGGTIVVHADGGRVRVEVDAPPGADPAEWKARIHQRLTQQGLDVEHVDVR